MTRRLIVNADDFGRTRGVSDGIIRAHQDGIVTSTTAMMNMPEVTHDLQRVKTEAPKLGLGVHLTFTAGRPLLPPEWVKSLVDQRGYFLSQAAVLADPSHLNTEELASELKAQVTLFNNVLGHLPDHLDAHHMIHLLPRLFNVYLDVADAFNLPVRIPFPRQATDLAEAPALIGNVPADVVESMLRADWQVLAERPVMAPDNFIMTFFGQRISVESLLALLDALPTGISELMTHPGLVDDQIKAQSSYNIEREKELAALTDPQVLTRIQKLDIDLVTYSAVRH
jgi:predicted glycoside hydrolase/deacetylase ChbG (UPF0249 family)